MIEETHNQIDDPAIVVSSFDRYAVCWAPFCYGIKKYWPEHFQPLYFITNEKYPPCGQAIKVGHDRGWADNLLFALEQIPSPHILYAQEDYWIQSPVDTVALVSYVKLLEADLADYIRLYPAPPPSRPFAPDDRLGILDEHAEYRTSLQMALWRKSVLQELLVPGENPWQFEVRGSHRSQVYGKRFLSVRKVAFGVNYIFTAIVDGEWSPKAFAYAQQENLEISFGDLPVKPLLQKVKSRVKSLLYGYARKFRQR